MKQTKEQKEQSREVSRQIAHLITGLILVALIYIASFYIDTILIKILIFIILIAGLVIALASKSLRIPVIWWFLKKFEHEQDLKSLPGKGVLFMFLGAFLSLIFFPLNTALAAITILALGDSIAPLVGMYHGKIRHPFSSKRYTEGFLAGIAVSFIGAMFFVSWPQALIAATAAMVIEGLDIELRISPADDNLVIPIVAGVVIWLVGLVL
jgi:dolichol kinase